MRKKVLPGFALKSQEPKATEVRSPVMLEAPKSIWPPAPGYLKADADKQTDVDAVWPKAPEVPGLDAEANAARMGTRRVIIPRNYVEAQNDGKTTVRIPTSEALAKGTGQAGWPRVYIPTGGLRELTPDEVPEGVGKQFYCFETSELAFDTNETVKDQFNMDRPVKMSLEELDTTMKVVTDLSIADAESQSSFLVMMTDEQKADLATAVPGDSYSVLRFDALTGRSALQQKLEDAWRGYYRETGQEVDPRKISDVMTGPNRAAKLESIDKTGFAVTEINGFMTAEQMDAGKAGVLKAKNASDYYPHMAGQSMFDPKAVRSTQADMGPKGPDAPDGPAGAKPGGLEAKNPADEYKGFRAAMPKGVDVTQAPLRWSWESREAHPGSLEPGPKDPRGTERPTYVGGVIGPMSAKDLSREYPEVYNASKPVPGEFGATQAPMRGDKPAGPDAKQGGKRSSRDLDGAMRRIEGGEPGPNGPEVTPDGLDFE